LTAEAGFPAFGVVFAIVPSRGIRPALGVRLICSIIEPLCGKRTGTIGFSTRADKVMNGPIVPRL